MEDTAKPSRALPIGVAAAVAVVVFGVLFAVNGPRGKPETTPLVAHGTDRPGLPTPTPGLAPPTETASVATAAPADRPAENPSADKAAPSTALPSASAPAPAAAPAPGPDKPAPSTAPPADKAAAAPSTAPSTAPPPDKPANPSPPAKTTAVLSYTLSPRDAKLSVDGKQASGGKVELPLNDKPVKLVATAPGYVTWEGQATAGKDDSIAIELKKEPSSEP